MTDFTHYRRTRNPGLVDSRVSPGGVGGIPGLIRWYAADVITGLNDNDLVETWPDRSGTQDGTSSGSGRPTYKTGILNGLPVVRFAGQHYIDHATINLSTASIYFIVWSRTNDGNNDAVLLYDSGAYAYLQYGSNWYTSVGNASTVAMAANVFMLKSNIYTGTQHLRYTNGSAEATQNSTAGLVSRYIGASGYNLYGDVAELLIYNAELTAGNKLRVENYLNDKYDLW